MIFEEQLWGTCSEADAKTDVSTAREILNRTFGEEQPAFGYVTGKTMMRNAIADQTGCSLMRAESLIDKMERAGKLRYEGDHFLAERGPTSWHLVD